MMNKKKIKMLTLSFAVPTLFLATQGFASDDCDYEKIKDNSYYTKNADLLAKAVEKDCPDLMDKILKKEKENDLFSATQGFMLNVLDHMSLTLQSMKGAAEDDPVAKSMQVKLKTVARFGEFLKQKCPDEGKISDACKARKTFKEYGKKLEDKFKTALAEEEAENKDQELNDSPEGLIRRACACDKFIEMNKNVIDRQKEIGKVSGTMNMITLNNAGSQIVDLKKIKADVASKYKATTNKELKKYKCKDTEDLTNPLLDGTGISGI
jgi:hypothetical protein